MIMIIRPSPETQGIEIVVEGQTIDIQFLKTQGALRIYIDNISEEETPAEIFYSGQQWILND
jgi:hypothetical protein